MKKKIEKWMAEETAYAIDHLRLFSSLQEHLGYKTANSSEFTSVTLRLDEETQP